MGKEQLTDQQDIAEVFNSYFSFKSDKKRKVDNKTICSLLPKTAVHLFFIILGF
jgi:hypothetical protein